MASNKKPLFHKPKTTGEVRKIANTPLMWIVSIGSLVLLAALSAFAVYAVTQRNAEQVVLYADITMNAWLLFLFLPLIAWIIAVGFRLAVKMIPLEMWRLPVSVKEANIKTGGRYLKFATLLLELETVLLFGYITLVLYFGYIPGDIPVFMWVAAVVITVVAFSKYAVNAAQSR